MNIKPLYNGLRTYFCTDTTMYSYLGATNGRTEDDEFSYMFAE
jgi:hypothetical protein